MLEVHQRGQGVLDDLATRHPSQRCHERHATGIFLVAWVVQALRWRAGRVAMEHCLPFVVLADCAHPRGVLRALAGHGTTLARGKQSLVGSGGARFRGLARRLLEHLTTRSGAGGPNQVDQCSQSHDDRSPHIQSNTGHAIDRIYA